MTEHLAAPPALVDGDRRLTRAEVAGRARAAAADPHGAAVRPGERVLLTGDNGADLVVGLLALAHADASIVLVDGRSTPDEIRRLAARSGADRVWHVGDDTPPPAGPAAPDDGGLDLAAWAAREDALVVWSSGSTGEPKGVVRSGASVLANTRRTAERMGYGPDDVMLPLLPFTHQYGMSLVLLWWTVGTTLVVLPPHRGDAAIAAVGAEGVTVVDATPSTYHSLLRLLDGPAGAAQDLGSVRMWCVGGAPLGAALAERCARRLGRPLLDGYGASETGNIALAATGHPHGCGRPLDGVRVEIHDADGTPVGRGAEGEIVVTTPDLMTGLLDDDAGVAPVPPGPYRTGDLGRVEADGTVVVVGRRRAVHRLGHTLYPEAIAARAEHLGRPVRVLPFDDERRGCELVFVVADPTGRGARYWRRVLAESLPAHEAPNRVVVVDDFPLTLSGKTDVEGLRRSVEVAMAIGDRAEGAPPAAPEPGRTPDVARSDRLDLVRDAAALIRRRREEIAGILERVSHRRTVEGEIDVAIETLEGAAQEVATYRPQEVARSAIFMPSNIPLYAYVLYLLVPSLYVDHATFRASRHLTATSRDLHELFAAELDLPFTPSELSQRRFVAGPVAEADVVVFTGTYENAETVRAALAPHQLLLFYGQGVNPFVVAEGADLTAAVEDLVSVRMLNSGQDCFGPDLVAVDDRVGDTFVRRLAERVESLRHGTTTDPDTDYASMYYRQAFADALDYLQRHADHIVAGGSVDLADLHLRPTVVDRPPHPKGVCEETFAPIFTVVRWSDVEELRSMLFAPYCADRAMGASVYGDLPEVVEQLRRRHEVTVNTTLLDADDGNAPFGGRGIMAGYVARGRSRIAEPLLYSKAVADHLGTPESAGTGADEVTSHG